MKVCLVNSSTIHCGVSEFGRRMEKALRDKGVILIPPGGESAADLIHVNWHPQTLGPEFRPNNPRGVPLSAYFHDTPEHSQSALWDLCNVRFTPEPFKDAVEVPYPATDGEFIGSPTSPFTIGWTGIRGDGHGQLKQLCAERGWRFNEKTEWLSDEDEIKRMANSDLNVLWYYASNRGKSLALMTCAAARKPLLINRSNMFSQAWPYMDEVYIAGEGMSQETAIDWAINDGLRRRPDRLPSELSWSNMLTKRIIPQWKLLLTSR